MVYFKEDYIFQGSRGGLTFSRVGGPIFSRGCGDQMLISIETYRIYVFQGVQTPYPSSGSAHAYDRSTCDIKMRIGFLMRSVIFQVTPQNMTRCIYLVLH